MSKVVTFPKWRKNRTPVEFFTEILQVAETHPEYFRRTIVFYAQKNDDGSTTTRRLIYTDEGIAEILGMVEIGKAKLLKDTIGGLNDE